MKTLREKNPTKWVAVCALFMAMNIALSSFSLPVPGGHLYLNDIVIVTAAILLDPLGAFAVGGIGAFLGDMFFYPTPMFVSLAVHGLQAVVISLFAHKGAEQTGFKRTLIGVILGVIIMVVGYTLGRAFIYSTPEYAILKLPFQILQAVVGAAVGMFLCFKTGLRKAWQMINK